ncbi:hypothetical protein [Mesorhizobium sp.]|uniref:hypothetical protein n=1 Tax=Mesorhizobium sp. TaxID=1871066 RepID=UPI0025FD203B|nr:hypothetical protein [Mesorhizobium sp.]
MGNAEGRRVGGSDMVEERSDRGQASVARYDGIVPLLLELRRESENEVSIKLVERNAAGFFRNRGSG